MPDTTVCILVRTTPAAASSGASPEPARRRLANLAPEPSSGGILERHPEDSFPLAGVPQDKPLGHPHYYTIGSPPCSPGPLGIAPHQAHQKPLDKALALMIACWRGCEQGNP